MKQTFIGNPFVLIILAFTFIILSPFRLPILMITWFWIILYCFKDMQNRVILLAFMITIYTFLLTRLTIPYIYNTEYITDSFGDTISFSESTYNSIYIAIFIAIISIFIGYTTTHKPHNSHLNYNTDSSYIKRVRYLSLRLFYFTYLFFVLTILEKVYFVLTKGYLEYYLNFNRLFPDIVYKFATAFEIIFYIFLATLPSKQEAKKTLILYLIIEFVSLLSGARNEFVLAFLFIVIYMYIRNVLTPEDPWLSKKGKIIIAVSLPAICILMFIVLLFRSNKEVGGIDFVGMIFDLLFQQGSSMQVLGLTFENVNSLDSRLFSFGPLIDKFNSNIIMQLLGDAKELKGNSIDMAVYGHNYGDYITYTFQPTRYLMGGGMGSSYIAEVWLDWGYIGIAIWSYLYGVILAKVYSWIKRNIWLTAFAFFMMMQIIYSPRACAIYFISEIISPVYLLIIFIIWLYARNSNQRI